MLVKWPPPPPGHHQLHRDLVHIFRKGPNQSLRVLKKRLSFIIALLSTPSKSLQLIQCQYEPELWRPEVETRRVNTREVRALPLRSLHRFPDLFRSNIINLIQWSRPLLIFPNHTQWCADNKNPKSGEFARFPPWKREQRWFCVQVYKTTFWKRKIIVFWGKISTKWHPWSKYTWIVKEMTNQDSEQSHPCGPRLWKCLPGLKMFTCLPCLLANYN